MLQQVNADLRADIQQGMDSGPSIDAHDLLAELSARYAETHSESPDGVCDDSATIGAGMAGETPLIRFNGLGLH